MPTRRQTIGSILLATATSSTAQSAELARIELRSRFTFEARVSIAAPQVVGSSSHGLRRIVPITGGEVSGPRFKGRVVPGGADWQFVRPDVVLAVEEKYTLE